jgi:peptidyl-prolyl cis-trans isomerase D
MLDYMRKNARSTAVKVLYTLIIIVFCFWGVGIMMGGQRVNVAATVDGEPITAQAFLEAHDRLQRSYQQIYRDGFTPEVAAQLNLEQRALDDLVTDLLLRREAVRLGLQVSDDEVRESILNIPAFHDGGRFDRSRYLAALRSTRLSPEEFEESQRHALLAQKLESLLTDGLYVSDEEVHDLFVLENEKVDVAYTKLPYDRFAGAVQVSDSEVSAYYEENRERFRTPEELTLAYVTYAPESFQETVPVNDDLVQAYYESHEYDFESPEEIALRHILVAVPPGADDAARAEARAKAEKILEEAKGGADFAALAREHSDDPLTKESGGDLGLVERGKLEAALDEAAFRLEDGEISDLIETDRGLDILKVDERKPSHVRPLAEVRDDVVRAIRENGADATTRDALEADAVRAHDGTDLEDIAKGHDLSVTTSPPVSAGKPLPGVKGGALFAAARALDVAEVGEVVGDEPPYYLFKVLAKTPSTIEPLDAVRERILEALRTEKEKDAAKAEAEGLLAAATGDDPAAAFTKAAAAKGYTVEDSGPIGRHDPLTKFDNAPIIGDLFALTPEAPRATHPYLLRADALAVVLKKRMPPDESELTDEMRESLRNTALARRRTQTLEAYRDMLRQRAEITVNPAIVTSARAS